MKYLIVFCFFALCISLNGHTLKLFPEDIYKFLENPSVTQINQEPGHIPLVPAANVSDAFRAEGISVGLYYSVTDWHHPGFPNIGNHPLRNNKAFGKLPRNWDNYLKYMHGQVEELMKNYGKIDIL